MSDKKKKSVKRRVRAIAARDLMTVIGGVAPTVGSLPDLTVGIMPQGPQFPRPGGPTIGFNPQGPTIGFNPTGPRNPLLK